MSFRQQEPVVTCKVYEFSKHIGALCVKRDTNVHKLGAKLGIDPTELLSMINGKKVPTKAVISGLARELDSDVRCLEKLAEEIRKGSVEGRTSLLLCGTLEGSKMGRKPGDPIPSIPSIQRRSRTAGVVAIGTMSPNLFKLS